MDGASQFLCVAFLRGSAVGPLFTCVPSVGKSKGRGWQRCPLPHGIDGRREERERSNKKT